MKKDFIIYNTKNKKKEIFKPIKENMVTMYSCGPTVYSTPHIGNMRAYTFVDTLVRVLKNIKNYEVKNLINITDVGHLTSDADVGEDKLDKAAKELNKTAWSIAKKHEKEFVESIDKLNILHPFLFPKATDHIQEQIEMIKELEKEGFTYKTKDGIYYDTSKFDRYNDFANIKVESLKAGIRVDQGEKRNVTDFALWKFSPIDKKRDMEWNSPWGIGFPGWHIECSAMAMKHLGNKIDIHTGGIDHISIHHTNEIAQTEVLTNDSFVNYWMHVNFLQLQNDNEEVEKEIKMSKSKGTAYTIFDLEKMNYDGQILKYFYLTAHYRKELKFNFEILDAVKNTVVKLKRTISSIKKDEGFIEQDSFYLNQMENALLNDLDTPKMLSIFHVGLNDNELTRAQKLTLIKLFDNITGLNLLNKEDESFYEKKDIELSEKTKELLNERLEARLSKNWIQADLLRDEIEKTGFIVKDKKNKNGNLIQIIEKK